MSHALMHQTNSVT